MRGESCSGSKNLGKRLLRRRFEISLYDLSNAFMPQDPEAEGLGRPEKTHENHGSSVHERPPWQPPSEKGESLFTLCPKARDSSTSQAQTLRPIALSGRADNRGYFSWPYISIAHVERPLSNCCTNQIGEIPSMKKKRGAQLYQGLEIGVVDEGHARYR